MGPGELAVAMAAGSIGIVMDNVLLFAYPGPVSVYKPSITGYRLTE
jgi:hypothetical protein